MEVIIMSKTISKSELAYAHEWQVPGNGLCIVVGINFNAISIVPSYTTEGDKKGYDTLRIGHEYRFEPEEAARFWSWYKGQDEFARHGERMAKALHFAMSKYQALYGKVYILPVETTSKKK